MNRENASPTGSLSRQPIQSICLAIDPRQRDAASTYFQERGCPVTAQGERLLVQLPPGTMEETYAGKSTGYRYETTICLPGGETFQKVVLSPLRGDGPSQVVVVLPGVRLGDIASTRTGERGKRAPHGRDHAEATEQ